MDDILSTFPTTALLEAVRQYETQMPTRQARESPKHQKLVDAAGRALLQLWVRGKVKVETEGSGGE